MSEPARIQRCVIPRHDGRRPATSAGSLVCSEHVAEFRDALSDIVDLWAELPYAALPLATPPRGGQGGRGGHRADPPAPVNLSALALMSDQARAKAWPGVTPERNGPRLESNGADAPDVAAILAAWVAEVAEERSTAVDVMPTVAGLVGALRQHLSWIVGQDWIREFDRELRQCRRWLAMAVGGDPMPEPYCDCPWCGSKLWTDFDRDVIQRRRYGQDPTEATGRTDRVRCTTCRRHWEGKNGLGLLLRMVRDERERREEGRSRRAEQRSQAG